MTVANWDLPTVMAIAREFPAKVERCSQRTSAILTRYTALRSFADANGKLGLDEMGKPRIYRISDYSVVQYYTLDLFSAFIAYKNVSDRG